MPATNLVFCTLLGPEGPDRAGGRVVAKRRIETRCERTFWILSLTQLDACFEQALRLEGYRPYFENYTVDASILDVPLRAPQS
jgi:hypothetical protein